MNKILIVSLVVSALGASSAALAQVAGPVGGPPKGSATPVVGRGRMKEMEKMNEEILAKLNLTPDQKAKIDAHQKEMALKRRDLMKASKGGGTDAADAKTKMQALRKENQEFMKQTLTKDQLKQLQELRRDAMKEMQSKSTAAPVAKP